MNADEPSSFEEVRVRLEDALRITMLAVADETLSRLEVELNERDAAAVVTGVLKAANAGTRLAMAQLLAALEEAGAIRTGKWDFPLDDNDVWATRYGNDQSP